MCGTPKHGWWRETSLSKATKLSEGAAGAFLDEAISSDVGSSWQRQRTNDRKDRKEKSVLTTGNLKAILQVDPRTKRLVSR